MATTNRYLSSLVEVRLKALNFTPVPPVMKAALVEHLESKVQDLVTANLKDLPAIFAIAAKAGKETTGRSESSGAPLTQAPSRKGS